MKSFFPVFATTLVLLPLHLFAAPSALPPSTEPVKESESEVKESVEKQKSKLETMQISEPPIFVKSKEDEEYFYPYKQSLGTRIGLLFDLEKLSNKELPDYGLGLAYMLPSNTDRHWEAHIDVISNSTGRLAFLSKWMLRPGKKIRPHVKTGIALNALPKDGLGSFLRWEQYELLVGIGLADLLKDPMSVRVDIEVTVGIHNIIPQVIFGYEWGWL